MWIDYAKENVWDKQDMFLNVDSGFATEAVLDNWPWTEKLSVVNQGIVVREFVEKLRKVSKRRKRAKLFKSFVSKWKNKYDRETFYGIIKSFVDRDTLYTLSTFTFFGFEPDSSMEYIDNLCNIIDDKEIEDLIIDIFLEDYNFNSSLIDKFYVSEYSNKILYIFHILNLATTWSLIKYKSFPYNRYENKNSPAVVRKICMLFNKYYCDGNYNFNDVDDLQELLLKMKKEAQIVGYIVSIDEIFNMFITSWTYDDTLLWNVFDVGGDIDEKIKFLDKKLYKPGDMKGKIFLMLL